MKPLLKLAAAGCMTLLSAQLTFAQGLKTPAPSPTQDLKQDFGLSYVEVVYSRPLVKGRTIMGDLVPYGKVWRTGANGATTITFGDDVTIGGKAVKAGKYGLLTIPNKNEWTIIITKSLDVNNPSLYKEENDVVRVNAKAENVGFNMESFSISFQNVTATSMTMMFTWEHTIVPVEIKTEVDSKVMAQIDEAMKSDKKPYFQAAAYYMDNGHDAKQALTWVNAAIAENPKAYYMVYLKARIQAKLGDKAGAKATAQQGITLADEAKNQDYVELNKKLIASL
jgi:hypothetical protein